MSTWWLLDHRIFNYIILTLYALNSLRWLVEGKPITALYWAGAFIITTAVTWGLEH